MVQKSLFESFSIPLIYLNGIERSTSKQYILKYHHFLKYCNHNNGQHKLSVVAVRRSLNAATEKNPD